MIEGSGSGSKPLTSGSGSGRPKNMWIWIRIRIRNTGLYPYFFAEWLQMSSAFLFFYVPEAYFMHFLYTCWFLNCSVQKTDLMYIKLSLYLFFYVALGLNDFDAGKSITQTIGRGGPWNQDFFGPWHGNERSECYLGSCNRCCPHQNHYIPRQINNRYINSWYSSGFYKP